MPTLAEELEHDRELREIEAAKRIQRKLEKLRKKNGNTKDPRTI
jgi:hypothetical protein